MTVFRMRKYQKNYYWISVKYLGYSLTLLFGFKNKEINNKPVGPAINDPTNGSLFF